MEQYLYGIDLGGTTTKFGFFTIDGELIEKFAIKTDLSSNGANILSDIAVNINNHLVKNQLTKSNIKGIGIGVPGPVTNGIANKCVNLGWENVNVKEQLTNLIHIKIEVSNDANIAGLGELWKGGGTGYQNLVFITLGTGVGGAIIVNNHVIDGVVGAAGEIGHAPTLNLDFKCNCGKYGCLETVASATGVVNIANKFINETTIPSNLREKSDLTAKMIFDAAKQEDQLAAKVVEVFGKNIGFVCATIGVVTNPEVFIFGGGVANAGDIIINTVKKYFKKYAFLGIKDTAFKLAELGNDAGIYGAAYLVKNEGTL
jgi:glucokinase